MYFITGWGGMIVLQTCLIDNKHSCLIIYSVATSICECFQALQHLNMEESHQRGRSHNCHGNDKDHYDENGT